MPASCFYRRRTYAWITWGWNRSSWLRKIDSGKEDFECRNSLSQDDKDGFRRVQKEVPGQVIESMGRRGKYLLFYLTDKVLISHLRMEGKYFYYPDQVPERKHAHVFFQFEDGGTLVYEDVRKFGTMELLASDLLDAYFISKKLGPEPSEEEFDVQVFQTALAKSKKAINPTF